MSEHESLKICVIELFSLIFVGLIFYFLNDFGYCHIDNNNVGKFMILYFVTSLIMAALIVTCMNFNGKCCVSKRDCGDCINCMTHNKNYYVDYDNYDYDVNESTSLIN